MMGTRSIIRVWLLLIAPSAMADDHGSWVAVGELAHPAIVEASGLARSQRHADRYWVVNDSGNSPHVYAVSASGERHGALLPRGVGNRDWEDLASFKDGGRAYLLIADIGDNNGVRPAIRLHAIEEPAELPGMGREQAVDVAWSVTVTYPGGGRDAEAVAVDGGYIYVLTKRTLPPELYRVPLGPSGDAPLELEWLGQVESLPPPTVRELADAPRTRQFGWQPTAMSFSGDGRRAIIVTNWRAFVFERAADEGWLSALNGEPAVVPMPDVRRAESVTFTVDETGFLTTFEARHAPIYRFERP